MDSLQLRQKGNDTIPKKRAHFARKARQRRITRIDSALKKDLFYSSEDYAGFGRELQEEENGLFDVFNNLSGAGRHRSKPLYHHRTQLCSVVRHTHRGWGSCGGGTRLPGDWWSPTVLPKDPRSLWAHSARQRSPSLSHWRNKKSKSLQSIASNKTMSMMGGGTNT